MEDNGFFINRLFRKQASFNILALMVSTIGPIVCAGLAGAYYGSGGLTIMALCSPLFLTASFFGYILSGGAQIVSSRFIAMDELENENMIYSAAIVLTVVVDIVICSALLAFKQPLLKLMAGGISPELSTYYSFFVLNAFVTMLIYIPLYFSKIAGRPQIGLVLTATMSAVSIAASLLLIRGMGIEAVALGQAIGAATGLLVSMFMLRKYFRFVFPKKLYAAQIFIGGSPVGLSRLYILVTTIALNSLFLRAGGGAALAVYGVVSMLHRFITAIIVGIAQTTVPLVGVFHEEQDTTSIKQTMRTAFFYGNSLLLAAGLLLFIFKVQIGMAFSLAENTGMFARAMPFYVAYIVLLLNGTLFSSYYNAAKRLLLANIIPFFQEFALVCACAYGFAAFYGINGIWIAFPVSAFASLSILALILVWIKHKQEEMTIPLLQNRRLERDGKYISFSVESELEKASEAAARISGFCEENGVSVKQTMQISMSIEEIITLIINNVKKKPFSVSVRLFLLGEMIILRIRNAGEKFDAIEYYKKNIADDIEKSLDVIGMKYIVQVANVIYYRQTFGINSLVVIL